MIRIPALLALVLPALLLLPTKGVAQRHELGERLGKLEAAWMAAENATGSASAARLRALPRVNAAVRAFFSFRLETAARELDAARLLLAAERPSPEMVHAASYRLRVASRVHDPRLHPWIEAELVPHYETPVPRADHPLTLAVSVDTPEPPREIEVSRTASGWRIRLRFSRETTNGDLTLVATLQDGAQILDAHRENFALIPDLETRRNALESLIAAPTPDENEGTAKAPPAFARATIRDGLSELTAWSSTKAPENEPRPGSRLRQLESLARLEAGAPLPAGQWHVSLPRKRGADRVRLAIPKGANEDSPLLLLAHGAGGSENMFFDALGLGRYVREGLARGAVVVAPRLSLMGGLDVEGLLDRLAAVRPFDRDRVWAVGHSMGAVRLLGAASRTERPFAALAVLAGGRPQRKAEALARTPLFLGTADEDFSRRGVIALADQMKEVEGARSEINIIESSEHLMVVADLVDEVFDFFDEQGLAPKR